MNNKEIIRKYTDFVSDYMKRQTKQFTSGEIESLTLNLCDVLSYDVSLYETFLEQPIECITLIKSVLGIAINNEDKDIPLRVTGVSDAEYLDIKDLRVEHIGNLVKLKGVIKRKSGVIPKLKYLNYLCVNPDCPYSVDKIKIPQNGDNVKKLKACPRCKSPTEIVHKDLVDFQQILLEENPENLDNPNLQPKNKYIYLDGDLTSPLVDDNLSVGSKVEVTGVVIEKVIETNNGGEKVLSELIIDTLNVELSEEQTTISDMTKEDLIEIKKLSKDKDIFTRLQQSIAPNIAGRELQKQGTLYYIVGGTERPNQRKHIHLLVVGNASLGKSQILRRLHQVLPKSVYASGENTSKAGLTGAAVRDEVSKEWTIEGGAMVYANGGYFLLDEADKMKKEDQTNMNEALEHSTVTINKVIKATLRSDCPTYAVANPHKGKFDESKEYIDQIKFDPTFLSRFDLVYILDSNDGDKEEDDVIDKLLGLEEISTNYIEDELLIKYLMYAKSLKPTISKDILLMIKKYYKTIKGLAKNRGSYDITYRQLGALVRLSEARAKLHLRDKVLIEDVQSIINLMNHNLNKLGVSEINTGVSNRSRNLITNIETALHSIKAQGSKGNIDNICNELTAMDVSYELNDVETKIAKLKSECILFEPRKGIYQLM